MGYWHIDAAELIAAYKEFFEAIHSLQCIDYTLANPRLGALQQTSMAALCPVLSFPVPRILETSKLVR